MKIDGKLIASEIKTSLKEKVFSLKIKNIIPHLAVVLIGNDPGSEAYVRQKEKVGAEIGAKVSLFNEVQPRTRLNLARLVNKLNSDPLVHGIIIQRPVPVDISKEELDLLVFPQKDVDGFHPDSPFTPPIALAVLKILEYVFVTAKSQMHAIASICYQREKNAFEETEAVKTPGRWPASPRGEPQDSFQVEEFSKDCNNWLKKQKILVIGRGETAGKPIAETLQKIGIKITIAHSKTNNLTGTCLDSNIIISCVGRANIVRPNMLNKDSILIGAGLHQENNKLKTDYNQEEISDKVAFWTPVPGGVGPVNVACLFENLISSIIPSK